MFQIIIDTKCCNKEALFYRASVFFLFNTVMQSSYTQQTSRFADLRHLIELLMDSVASKLLERPTIILEFFFSKTRGECLRIQDGIEGDVFRELHNEKDEMVDYLRLFSLFLLMRN
jgi:hypothetical protein